MGLCHRRRKGLQKVIWQQALWCNSEKMRSLGSVDIKGKRPYSIDVDDRLEVTPQKCLFPKYGDMKITVFIRWSHRKPWKVSKELRPAKEHLTPITSSGSDNKKRSQSNGKYWCLMWTFPFWHGLGNLSNVLYLIIGNQFWEGYQLNSINEPQGLFISVALKYLGNIILEGTNFFVLSSKTSFSAVMMV